MRSNKQASCFLKLSVISLTLANGLCRAEAEVDRAIDQIQSAFDKNERLIPPFKAVLEIQVENRLASVEPRDQSTPESQPVQQEMVVPTVTPSQMNRYDVVWSNGRFRIRAKQINPDDLMSDLLFDGENWRTLEKSGRYVVIRRKDQLCSLGPANPVNLQSGGICVTFPEELKETKSITRQIHLARVNDDLLSLRFDMSADPILIYLLEVDSGFFPRRLWVELNGNVISYREFKYEVLAGQQDAKICTERIEFSLPSHPVQLDVGDAPVDEATWNRTVRHRLVNIELMQNGADLHEVDVASFPQGEIVDLRIEKPNLEPVKVDVEQGGISRFRLFAILILNLVVFLSFYLIWRQRRSEK